jgi:hypothetical protein
MTLTFTTQVVRTLIYPEGADLSSGGELALVPGSHFYRDCHNRAHGSQVAMGDTAISHCRWLSFTVIP